MAEVCHGILDTSGDTTRDGEADTVVEELAAMFIVTREGRVSFIATPICL